MQKRTGCAYLSEEKIESFSDSYILFALFPFLIFLFLKMYFCFPSSQPLPESKRIFLLDVDGTLILSKSGRKWADSASDWIWAHPEFPTFLQDISKTAIVALVTNQSSWNSANSQAQTKLTSILNALETVNGWKPWCLVATAKPKQADPVYRKPSCGLYDVLLKELGWSVAEVEKLEMCGDAVGAEDPNPAYRWANSDRVFAETIGATFLRPSDLPLLKHSPIPLSESEKEIVILVGNPGSGKSTLGRVFAENGYTHVEQDKTKTAAATFKAVRFSTKSVIVDATHAGRKHRAPYIALAKERGWSVRILWLVRDGRPWNALRTEGKVPEIAYAVYSKYFEEPTEAECPVEIY